MISKGIKKLLILAEQYYLSGEKGFTFLPFNTRVAISVASGVYREIGVQLENENFNWQNGRQITSIFSKIKITLFKTFKEIFYLRNKKKHNSELHIYLENFMHIGVQTMVTTKQEFVTQQLLRVLLTLGATEQ